ncbi:NAD(P)-binding protein [Aspergillus ellipticus CBS 707.79]|uniref:NAD(P)-binding protein n=1 Tax=Aspergillus ellipticus CBS 707.79 TaxID=1448320 RepID=A0A319DH87_9EURO|nr:NAD(P)-binding protein [Aspergillus ellipticus CBS 707.79]
MIQTQTPLRVGILSADEGAKAIQAIYLPALQALPTSYQVKAIYNGSTTPHKKSSICNDKLASHHHGHHHANGTATPPPDNIPTASTPDDILTDPTIGLVLNFMPNEYHETYTIAALNAGKHVMVETPVSLSIPSARRIIEAEKRAPNNAKMLVACARRYAPCVEVFKREVASLDRIYYARCRNIAGPCAAHTATAPRKKAWGEAAALANLGAETQKSQQLKHGLMQETFLGQDLTKERIALSEFLASLGCHDLGLMRDTLGYPDTVSSISVNEPYYSAVFHYYSGGKGEHPFTLMYETGADAVPRCDAHLAVYGDTKTVSIHYGLPYGRRQPVRVVVETADENGDMKKLETVSSWEEGYQEELKALHAYLTQDQPAKTTAGDAMQDLKLFQTIFEQYDRQCGTIRTPLG